MRCSNYILVTNYSIAYWGATFIRGLTVIVGKSKKNFIYSRYNVKQITLAPKGR